jgi:hypothetical protein
MRPTQFEGIQWIYSASNTADGHSNKASSSFPIPGKDKNDPYQAFKKMMSGTLGRPIAFFGRRLYVPNRRESREARSGILPESRGS